MASKKKVAKRASSVDEKDAPAKKLKKVVKAEDSAGEKSGVTKKKVLKKKKKVVASDKKDTSDSETPLSSNLIQVTITKEEALSRSNAEKGSEKASATGATKKVVRKIKKIKTNALDSEEKSVKVTDTKVDAAPITKESADTAVSDMENASNADSNSGLPRVQIEKTVSPQMSEIKVKVPVKPERVMEVTAEGAGVEEGEEEKPVGSSDDELMLHPPELSKWERDDYDWDISDAHHPSRKRSLPSEKSVTMLPRFVLKLFYFAVLLWM